MSTVATYAHIDYSQSGIPYVAGTKTKVKQVVLDHLAHDWTVADIHRNYPYLSMAQIHSALAYYYDHQEEIDRSIEEGLRTVAAIQDSLGESPLRLKLKARRVID